MFYFISCLYPRSDFGQTRREESTIVKIIEPTVIKETHTFHKEREKKRVWCCEELFCKIIEENTEERNISVVLT